jgi:fibronectin-binding autotransporter adhesin
MCVSNQVQSVAGELQRGKGSFSLFRAALLLALAVLLNQFAVPSAFAAGPFYWDNLTGAGFGTAGGTWSSAGNTGIPGWSTDSTAAADPSGANIITTTNDTSENFGSGTAGLAAGTVTVSGAVNSGNIIFGSASGAITISGGTSITLPAAATITLNNAADTISTTLAGAATSLGISGGTLTLGGNNTYAGSTTVSAGTLKAGSTTALSANSAFSVAAGATLDLGSYNNTIKSLSTATGTITDSSAAGSGGTLKITAMGSTAQLFTGSLGLQFAASAQNVDLTATGNTFSGGTTFGIGSGGANTRLLMANRTLGTGTPGALTSGYFGTGPITLGVNATDRPQIMFQTGANTINNAIVVNSALGNTDTAGTFRVDSTGNVIAGTINANLANVTFKNGSGTGAVSLTNTISGASGLMLSASAGTSLNVTLANTGTANSYAGDTTISSVKETLTLGAANQIPNGAGKGNLIITNGTFNLGGFSETINGLSGSGGIVDGVSGTPTLTVGDNNATSTFSGVIKNTAGTLALIKTGNGTLTLSGVNTYGGNTTINAGRLQGVVGGSSANSTVIVNATTATNSVSITSNTQGWTNAALTVSAAGVLEFSFGAVTPSTTLSPLNITGAAAFTTTPTVSVLVNSGLALGVYPLMTWGSTSGTVPTTANLTVSTLAANTAASLSVSGNTLNLVISSPAAVYWDNNGATAGFGTAAGTWASPTTGNSSQGWSTDETGGTLPVNFTTTVTNLVGFGFGATGLGAGTITVSGSVTNAAMTFASGSGAITLSGGTIYFPAAGTITVNNTSDTISSALPGTGTSLTTAGTGTLILSGNNTYSGATTNSAGTLKAGSTTGLSPNSAFSVAAGATLDLGGFNNTISSLSTATGTITDSSAAGSGGTLKITTMAQTAQLFTGSLALQWNAGQINSTILTDTANTFSGGITAGGSTGINNRFLLSGGTIGSGTPGALTSGVWGTGAVTLGTATTEYSQIMFNGGTTINNAIVVNSALGNSDAAGTFRVDSTGNVIAGTINANLANATFRNQSGTGAVSLTNTISGASGLMLSASAGTSLNVTLANTGTANSYAGDTTISSVKETLTLGAANQIPNGAGKGNLIITNGTFNLGGFSETINGLSGSGGIVDGVSGTPTLTVGDNNATSTFSGVIKNTAGTLALIKTGNGTLTLSGVNTYGGNTTINAGRLQGVVGGSSANSTVIVNATTATNSVSITSNTQGWTNAALTVSAAGVLEFSFGAVTPSTTLSPLNITGAAAFTTTPTVSVLVNSGLAPGTYPLMTWGSTSGTVPTTANLTVSTLAANTVASLSVSGNTLNLVISSTVVYWDNNGATAGFGTAAGTWASPTTGNSSQGWSTDGTGSTLPVNFTTTVTNAVSFGNGATGLAAGTITVSGNVTNAQMTFASGSGAITLSGGTIYFPAAGTIIVSNTSDTISSVLAGAGTSLTTAGTGTLILSGNNTYSGATTNSAGTLKAGSTTALSTNSGFSVAAGATLDLGGYNNTIKSLSATATGTITDSSAAGSGGTLTITAMGSTAQLFTGSLGLQFAASAQNVDLTATGNTFSGGTTFGIGSGGANTRIILNGRTLGVGTPGALTSGYFGTGPITLGVNATDRPQIMFQGASTINNAIVVNSALGNTDAAGTFRVDSTGNVIAGTINANLANATFRNGGNGVGAINVTGAISGNSGLTLLAGNGTGTLNVTLNNTGTANSYAGDTTISSVTETLTLGAANQIPNGTGKGNLIITNGTFNLGGFSETINGLSGSGGIVDGVSGTPTLTVGDNNATSTFSGVIKNTAGTLALIKTGNGTLTLSGVNTYGGNTTINAGRLQGVVGGSSANSTVIVNATTATNSVSITSNTQGWTNAALTVSAAGVLEFSFGAVTPSTTLSPLNITGAAAFTTTPTVSVLVNSGLAPGTYPLMTWGSTSGTVPTTANLTVSTLAANTAASLSVSGNTLNLVISSTVVYWDNNGTTAGFGTAAGTWASPTTGNSSQGWSTDGTGSTLPVDFTTLVTNAVNFGNGATGLGAGTITVSGSVTNAGMTFASGSGAITLSGGTIYFPAATSITVNNTSNNINSVVAGGGTALTKAGPGTLTLSGANTYTGSNYVGAGVLDINNASSLGTSSSVGIASGAALTIEGGITITNPMTIAGSGVAIGTAQGALLTTGTNTLTGLLTLSSARISTVDTNTLTLTGGITNGTAGGTTLVGDFTIANNPINVGNNGVNFAGDGASVPPVTGKTIRLNAAGNNWNNALLFFAGIVQLGIDNAMPTGAPVQFGWNTVDNARSTLNLNGHNQTVATIETTTQALGASGAGTNISITGGGTLTVNQSAASKEFNGIISDGASPTALTKAGTGTLMLSGTNTYTGNTTISAGRLALLGSTGSGCISNTANIVVAGGAAFDVSGLNYTFTLGSGQTLSGTGTTSSGTVNGSVNMNLGSLALTYTNGQPPLTVTNGTLTMNTNPATITVTGTALAGGTMYKLIAAGTGGAVAGTATNKVTLAGTQTAGSVGQLSISNSELYVSAYVASATNATYTRGKGVPMRILISDLLTNASASPGETLSLQSISATTTNSGTLTSDATFIYVPTNTVNDAFTYTVVSSPSGATASASVLVTAVDSFGQATGQVTITNSTVMANFWGIPGYNYNVERATNVTFTAGVSNFPSANAATNGAISVTDDFIDLGGPPSSAYYRLHYNP